LQKVALIALTCSLREVSLRQLKRDHPDMAEFLRISVPLPLRARDQHHQEPARSGRL